MSGAPLERGDVLRLQGVAAEVEAEVTRAAKLHGGFASLHEGYAVILEELDELWTEVKRREPDRAKVRAEALQVAAMAVRLVMMCDERRCSNCGVLYRVTEDFEGWKRVPGCACRAPGGQWL